MLCPHLRGQVSHTPGQGNNMALQPLEPLGVVLILPCGPALPVILPLVLVVVQVPAAYTGDTGQT